MLERPAPGDEAAAGAAPVIAAHDLHAHFGKIHVLQGVDLTVGAGEAVALLGRNGVGKTTTLRTTLGLMPRSKGRVVFQGTDITRLAPHKLAALGIGYVPQGRGIFPLLSVEENLTLGLTGEPDPVRLEETFARFPRLEERLKQAGGTLSGGEQQMLAIARCLMMGPRLLILDEPTEGIMPKLVAEIRRTIQSINRSGVAILLVEQNVKTALRICRRTYLMEKGRIAWEGTSDDLKADQDTIHRYLGLSLQGR
ncbi:ABC transporter ATP-binding protein [Acuticoccus sp. I52.16.1]|uniref:ABC transporter ATP-binding protein n=1 Tax=Acuticoccus sp. I52.16.1 TaxID=2928472 RepID=UPI001FD12C95|nr:ABC transporter ATP-binding protein [Acuticoccus sp. I52.16.1]UOM35727.1 ABC transporter ATP-binding protein [Acuticoccus sp. I52.16.1]